MFQSKSLVGAPARAAVCVCPDATSSLRLRLSEVAFFLLPELSKTQSAILGVGLIVLGVSFAWKAYNALVKGRILIWRGFLPFTLLSPFVNHFPAAKNSLLQYKEGLWVHLVMGPLLLVLSVLSACAGLDYVGLPGTESLNSAITAGGKTSVLSFDPRRGYAFHLGTQTTSAVNKVIKSKIQLDADKALYTDQHQKLDDVAR